VVEERGSVVAFLEKDLSRPGPGVINGGIYVLKREILDLIHDLPCSLEQDIFPALVERRQIRGCEFDGYFLDIGLPETLERGHLELPGVRVRPAALLDRNALVNSSDENPEAFQWMRGAVEAVRKLNDRGYYVFVSYLPGRAHKTLAAGDPFRWNAVMQQRLAAEGAHVDRFYGELSAAERNPGFNPVFDALNEWPIVRERSFFIGASGPDIEAARSAGIVGHALPEGNLARAVDSFLTQSSQG
jgi:histidinol phosphatase-like enzyme